MKHLMRRFTASLMACVLLLTVVFTPMRAAADVFLWGDINGDQSVTMDDAIQLLKYLADLIDSSAVNAPALDLTGDRAATMDDAIYLLKYLADLAPAMSTHTVCFYDDGGALLKEETVFEGQNAAPPQSPAKEGFDFAGWSGDYTNVTEDRVLTAVYTPRVTAPTLAVETVRAQAGETVQVAVTLYNNPGILGMSFAVQYDTSALTLTGAENGAALAALNYTRPARFKSGAIFSWYGEALAPEQVQSGAVLTLTFRVANAAAGAYAITLTGLEGNAFDLNLAPAALEVIQGGVQVSGEAERQYTVRFLDSDGALLKEETVFEGQNAAPPRNPAKEGFDFAGWSGDYTNVTEDRVLTAVYTPRVTAPTLAVETVRAQAGETVQVAVTLYNNPGILGMSFAVQYDTSALTLTGAENGAALAALNYTRPARFKSGAIFSWYGEALAPEQVQSGAVLTLTFRVANAAAGAYAITLTGLEGNAFDLNLAPVALEAVEGSIQIQ